MRQEAESEGSSRADCEIPYKLRVCVYVEQELVLCWPAPASSQSGGSVRDGPYRQLQGRRQEVYLGEDGEILSTRWPGAGSFISGSSVP